ncbi:UvrD-helicase domain-containing protein [Snodgrassella alvi]|jgi:DNA helicase II / ATP-dependent DNA helicase PcrA|uniref:DNA 3'-5' helicase n=1 Tax=Snodgrassella alvi TaxID=1196083 RepID=A0A855FMX2_9NEIS|nr:UvrD-helicase domain-containing protein [Snodgrassella alvi]PIT58985.1 DNA helicase II [Snodgrassella alvi]
MEILSSAGLLAGLNSEQLAAVTWPAQPALVLAGAGSGKTRVLTTRIAWLLHTGQASVHSILAVTFTNKAAKEMQLRLSALLPFSVRAMWLGTFHGLCHRFLRLHYQEAGLPKTFQILDIGDQLAVVKRLLKQLNIADEVIAPRSLQGFINAQKENGLRASQLTARDPHERQMIECYAAYDSLCQNEGVVDFAELMLRSYEILQSNEVLRSHYQNRFNHVLIDEFQDTNKLQYAWLKLLAGEHAAVFAVGDDDQSIYRFRGAEVANMTRFLHEFGVSEPIRLEQNYRSAGNILTAANAVIAHNASRLGKNLRTEAGSGEKIRVLQAINDIEEAHFIVDEVKALHREGLNYMQMAVLYRSNAQSRVLEQALFRAGIPYKIYGGLRFYERQEIKHALAYLRLAANPNDDNALLRVINVPARGIGARSIENIQAAANEAGTSLWQAATSLAIKNSKIAAFVHLIENLQAQAEQVSLPELMAAAIYDSGLMEHYRTQKGEQQERINNLEELLNAAVAFKPQESGFDIEPEYDENNPLFAVLSFLSTASLEAGEHQAGQGEDALQLMTVHAAKGLEFDGVFLTGLEEGLFPSEYSMAERDGLEEERRLMYVAITRARKRLYLTMAEQRLLHGQTHFALPSRFVDEIPEVVLQYLSAHKSTLVTRQQTTQRTNPFHSRSKLAETPASSDFDGFRLGQNVHHERFGTGVIIDASHKAEGARLTINFGKQGIKELDTVFAKSKLTIIS